MWKDKKKAQAYNKKYYAGLTPEKKAEHVKRVRQWVKDHPERRREIALRSYHKNKVKRIRKSASARAV